MKRFSIGKIIDIDENPFDRQERISWWRQERLSSAKVMVVGAGAIGNETLKNLALLGVGNLFIVDFDTIALSNLSRTVLFRKADAGKRKAEIAAERVRELCLADQVRIDWFHGDVVWELGGGVYREMDLVLGCLDNIETRFAVNRRCWAAGTPWIDAGIYELGLHLGVFTPPIPPCYECSATPEQRIAARRRYSCDNFKRAILQEGKIPTVQIASALVAALQVQEAIKLLCGQEATIGKRIYFQGKDNYFDLFQLSANPDCQAHISYPNITALPLATSITLREFLVYVSQEQYSGVGVTLDRSAVGPAFVVSAACRACGSVIELLRPSFRIYDTEIICDLCKKKGVDLSYVDTVTETEKTVLGEFNLSETEDRILDMSLHELGIPFLDIVAVKDKNNSYRYYELSKDKNTLFPNFQI